MPHTRWWRCIPPTTTSWRSLLLVLVGIVLGGVLGGLLLLVLLVVVVEVARLPHRRSPFRYITSGQAGVPVACALARVRLRLSAVNSTVLQFTHPPVSFPRLGTSTRLFTRVGAGSGRRVNTTPELESNESDGFGHTG